MLNFNKTPVLAVCFLHVVSLSLANTKSPPPDDYVGKDKLNNRTEVKEIGYRDGIEYSNENSYANSFNIKLSKRDNSFTLPEVADAIVHISLASDVFGILNLPVGSSSLMVFERINIPEDSILVFRGYIGTRHMLVSSNQWMDIASTSKRIVFEVEKGVYVKSRIIYGNGLCGIEPTTDLWYPAPEASTYGAAFFFSALGVLVVRKRKRRKPHSLTPSGVPV